MVGVSTEQNIANIIPAIQLDIKKFIIIESSQAHDKKWAKGLEEVLKKRKIIVDFIILNKDEDSHITKISEKIKQKLDAEPSSPIVWNVGGGQKPHQFAIWQTFNERKKEDIVCYANPFTKKLEKWYYENQNLEFDDTQNTSVHLSAEEILTIFGYSIKNNNKTELIYKKGQVINLKNPTKDLLSYDDFREFLFRLPSINTPNTDEESRYTVEDVLRKLISNKSRFEKKIKQRLSTLPLKNFASLNAQESLSATLRNFLIGKRNKDGTITRQTIYNLLLDAPQVNKITIKDKALKEILSSDFLKIEQQTLEKISEFKKTSFYFEQIVVQRIKALLDSEDTKHNIVEAYANLEISKSGNEQEQAAEYDVFCVTDKGMLFAFDAKTFDFERKDSDARLHNLLQAGGRYVNFFPVIPYHPEDVEKDYFPQKLRELPEKLKKRGIKFFVIADDSSTSKNPLGYNILDKNSLNF